MTETSERRSARHHAASSSPSSSRRRLLRRVPAALALLGASGGALLAGCERSASPVTFKSLDITGADAGAWVAVGDFGATTVRVGAVAVPRLPPDWPSHRRWPG